MSLPCAGSILRVLRGRGVRRWRFGTTDARIGNPVPAAGVVGVDFIRAGAVLLIDVDSEADGESLGEGLGDGRRGC